MKVILASHSPIQLLIQRIRRSTSTQQYSDSTESTLGESDEKLCYRAMTQDQTPSGYYPDQFMECLHYFFILQDIPRSVLLQLTRHRHSTLQFEDWDGREISVGVQSSRFTLKKQDIRYQASNNPIINEVLQKIHQVIEEARQQGVKNDELKALLTDSTLLEMDLDINGRSLRNLLTQRTFRTAYSPFRSLATQMFESLPIDHRFLYEDFFHT